MEQLQQTLNKAIEMWFTYKFIWIENLVYCDDAIVCIKEPYDDITYHELFSKDSWLMELVKWKEPENQAHMILWWLLKYHFMMMWPMTAQEKIDYFSKNAYLPN